MLRAPKLPHRGDELPYVFCFGERLRLHLIPKNAHYAMNKYGMNQGNKIFDIGIPRKDVKEREGGVYRVMCVRHPLDRLVSCYSFFCLNETWFSRGQLPEDYYFKMSFEEFCEAYEKNYEFNIHTVPQIFYKGGQDLDLLFRIEDIKKGWYELHKEFPDLVKPEISAIGHKSKRGPWQEYYSPELRKTMEDLLGEDLALYEEAVWLK